MIAVQGQYENGRLHLLEKAPTVKANVIVIFPGTKEEQNKQLGTEEKKRLFEKFSGSIHREINEKVERLQALDEKYADID